VLIQSFMDIHAVDLGECCQLILLLVLLPIPDVHISCKFSLVQGNDLLLGARDS